MFTVTQAAEALGMNPRTARNICAEHNIGTVVNARLRLLAKSDLPKIAKLKKPVGNPNFQKQKTPKT